MKYLNITDTLIYKVRHNEMIYYAKPLHTKIICVVYLTIFVTDNRKHIICITKQTQCIAGIQFSDLRRMQCWVDLVGWGSYLFSVFCETSYHIECWTFFSLHSECWLLHAQRNGRHTCVTSVGSTFLRRPTTTICISCLWTSWTETRGRVIGTLTGLKNSWSDIGDFCRLLCYLMFNRS